MAISEMDGTHLDGHIPNSNLFDYTVILAYTPISELNLDMKKVF